MIIQYKSLGLDTISNLQLWYIVTIAVDYLQLFMVDGKENIFFVFQQIILVFM